MIQAATIHAITDIPDVLVEIKDPILRKMERQDRIVIKLTETKTRDVEIFLNYRLALSAREMKVEELHKVILNQTDLINLRQSVRERMKNEAIEERKNALEGVQPKTNRAFSCFGKKATPKVLESQKEEVVPKKAKAKKIPKSKSKSKEPGQDPDEGLALLGLKDQGVQS